MLGTSCIFEVAVELMLATFCNFFYAFTPFLLWCSTFVSHAFPSSHIQAHNSKHEENAQLQLQKK